MTRRTAGPRHRQERRDQRHDWRRRLARRRGPTALLVAALLAVLGLGQGATLTDAQWTDQAYAEGTVSTGQWVESLARAQLIEVDGLSLDVLDAATASAEYPDGPGTRSSAIDVNALESLVGLDLPALAVPLVGNGVNRGLLDLEDSARAGLLNGYASAESHSITRAASGAVTDDGAVDLSPVADPSDTDLTQLDLTGLLDSLAVGGLTEEVVSEVGLGLGALASSAAWTTGERPTSEYVLAGATLQLTSPAVGGLVDGLTGAIEALSTTLTDRLGPEGPLQQVLNGLTLLPLNLGLAEIDLGTPQLNAAIDLGAVLDELLGTPLTSADGLVAIDLATGTISVDLRRLVADGDLNGLRANTELLTEENITCIVEALTDALDDLVERATTSVETALNETTLRLNIAAELNVLLSVADIDILADITVGDLLAREPLTLDVRGSLLGIPISGLLDQLLTPVTDLIVPALLGPVGNLLEEVPTLVGDTVGTTVGNVTGELTPVLDPLLTQLLRVTVNSQQTAGPASAEAFTVRALAIDLLPVLGDSSVTVNLASSSVQVWQPAAWGG